MSCDACHTVAPQLTSFGRFFKMNGYVMSTNQLNPSSSKQVPKESIDSFPPLSVMLQVSNTWLSKAQPGTQNNTTEFPQQLSLFYAGRLAPHLGACEGRLAEHRNWRIAGLHGLGPPKAAGPRASTERSRGIDLDQARPPSPPIDATPPA